MPFRLYESPDLEGASDWPDRAGVLECVDAAATERLAGSLCTRHLRYSLHPEAGSYSNLGYALLGAVLDEAHGDWFAAVRQQGLDPAGISAAALVPAPADRVASKLFGHAIKLWALGESSFAVAGGVWSTFDDLCRYADWALESGAGSSRTVSWQREGASSWINGEVRAAGAVIASAAGVTAVVHTIAKAPHAADTITTALIEQEVRSTRGGC